MNDNISDIEVLALQCRSDNSRLYVEEAIRCYRAGAYRAAIVSTWVAVVFDLMDKIRELSVNGDAVATAEHTRFESYLDQIDAGNEQGIRNALEFERTILKTCRDSFQLFDQHQYTDLDRLREDRHRCAHPSFQRLGQPYQPSPEQARLHLRNAVSHVMALPPVQGKAALATLRTLVTSQFFPLDVAKAAIQLRASPLGRPTASLLRGFVDSLVFEFVTKESELFGKVPAAVALSATFSMFPAEVEPRVRQQLSKAIVAVPDAELAYAVALLTHVTWAWEGLAANAQDKVSNFIKQCTADQVVQGLHSLNRIPALQETINARISTLTIDELAQGLQFRLGEIALPRILELLSGVRNWTSANEVIARLLMPVFELLTADHIRTIIQMPRTSKADLPGANAYTAFIQKVAESKRLELAELRALLEQNHAEYLATMLDTSMKSVVPPPPIEAPSAG